MIARPYGARTSRSACSASSRPACSPCSCVPQLRRRSSGTRSSCALSCRATSRVEVVALFNATTTLRATERTDIAAGREVAGDVAVLDGPLTVAGHVTGRVLAINSDVILARGARIDGDLLVVGGEVEGSEGAVIGGELRIYHAPLRYTQQGDQLVASLDETSVEEQWWRRFERRGRRNFNRLEIASAGVYNRVEGLPVRMGPVLYRDQGWGHFRLDATAVVRTESSFSVVDAGRGARRALRGARRAAVRRVGRRPDLRRRRRRGAVAAEQRGGGARVVPLPPRLSRLLRPPRRPAVRRAARDGQCGPDAVVRRRALAGARRRAIRSPSR